MLLSSPFLIFVMTLSLTTLRFLKVLSLCNLGSSRLNAAKATQHHHLEVETWLFFDGVRSLIGRFILFAEPGLTQSNPKQGVKGVGIKPQGTGEHKPYTALLMGVSEPGFHKARGASYPPMCKTLGSPQFCFCCATGFGVWVLPENRSPQKGQDFP